MRPRALVLSGDGINCEDETRFALELAGFDAETVHISRLLENPARLDEASLLVLPGGFSFGDEIASGRVLAIKIMHGLKESLHRYIDRGRLVLGICNGFQALVQMGLLPTRVDDARSRYVSLLKNSSGRFINRWVGLAVEPEKASGYLEGLREIALPVRHGEGRISAREDSKDLVRQLSCLHYAEDINGSQDRIAALQNEAGTILGMMPHPEAFVRWSQHPDWTGMKARDRDYEKKSPAPHGLAILKNACKLAGSM
ncbi:MAG: phosphoribosylformylglycinamidine synthase subunit PurQ [Candidatus Obscuribacterales bacterium]